MNCGTYEYFLNNEPTGVVETFKIEFLPDGRRLTTSVRDAQPFQTKISVETTETNNEFQNCRIVYRKADAEISADYEFSDGRFNIRRESNGRILQDEFFDLPENFVFFPLMRVFQGRTILKIAAIQDWTAVLVPDIQPATVFENLLQPTFDSRKAEKWAMGTVKYQGTLTDALVFSYLSKHYDDDSEFWIIRKNGLLFSYEFRQSDEQFWEVRLKTEN